MTGVCYMIPFVAAGGMLHRPGASCSVATRSTEVNGGRRRVTDAGLTDLPQLSREAGSPAARSRSARLAFGVPGPGARPASSPTRWPTGPASSPASSAALIAAEIGAGFLGGLVAGLLAGAVVLGLSGSRCPRRIAGIMPVVVYPLLGTIVVGVVMFVVIGQPIAAVHTRSDRLADRPVRQPTPSCSARIARPDDGLRHGRPGQQGRLHLRRSPAWRAARQAGLRSWPP